MSVALTLTDRLILATIADCNECEAGFPEEALYGDLNDVYWQMYCWVEGRPLPSRADLAGRIRELIADGFIVWRHGGPIAHMLPGYSGLDSEGLVLTDAGKKEAASFHGWLNDEVLVERAAAFAEPYIVQYTRQLPFKPIIPPYLPAGTRPLPEIDIEDEQLRLTFYADDGEVIVEQTRLERTRWLAPAETERHETLAGVPIWVKEGQMTSIWAAMTFEWQADNCFCRVIFNWIHRVWTSRPDPPPVVLDDTKRDEAQRVIESMLRRQD